MEARAMYQVVNREALPRIGQPYEFEGRLLPGTEVSFLGVDMAPTAGVRLHQVDDT